jgi:hypothetical protein
MTRSRTRPSRALVAASVASALAIALGASVAHADLFGGDVAVLSAIFETSLKQLDEARRMTETLGRSYREVQRVARYAAETKDAFRELQRLDGDRVLNSGVRAMNRAFPEAAWITEDVRAGSGWRRGAGSLGPEMEACIRSIGRDGAAGVTPQCDHLRRAASAERIHSAVTRTWGDVPAGRLDHAAVRAATVQSERERILDVARTALVSADASDLLARCKDARDPVVCDRIAAEAQVKGYEQQAETNRRLGELVQQQTVANELQLAAQRRAASEERARRAALLVGLADARGGP